MTRDDVLQLIRESADPDAGEITADTHLIGRDGVLDSIALVNLIIDVEALVADRFGVQVTIANERALSQTRSPFRTAGSLADYVVALAAGTE